MSSTIRIKNNIPKLQKFLGEDISSIQKAAAALEISVVEKINSNIAPPLSPKTIEWKSSHPGHGGSLALVATEQLREQITTRQGTDKTQSVDVGVFGSRAEIAAIHEYGVLSKNIPERSFLRSTLSEKKDVIKEVFGINLKIGIEKTTIKE